MNRHSVQNAGLESLPISSTDVVIETNRLSRRAAKGLAGEVSARLPPFAVKSEFDCSARVLSKKSNTEGLHFLRPFVR